MTVEDLKRWAARLEREHRFAQAILVKNMAWEVEHGAKWLEIMAAQGVTIPDSEEDNLKSSLKAECEALSDEIIVQLALAEGKEPS